MHSQGRTMCDVNVVLVYTHTSSISVLARSLVDETVIWHGIGDMARNRK